METHETVAVSNPLLIIAAYLTTAATFIFSVFLALDQGILDNRLLPLLAIYLPFTLLETALMLGHLGKPAQYLLFFFPSYSRGRKFFCPPAQ